MWKKQKKFVKMKTYSSFQGTRKLNAKKERKTRKTVQKQQ